MANAIYPIYKTAILSAGTNTSLTVDDATDGPFCALVDTGTYTYSAAHDFYSDLSGVIGTDQRITTPTVGSVAEGVFDGDNLTYSSVTGASVEALVIYRHNAGANTTWRLVAYVDTSVTGLPVTPNGGDITVTWNASGIFLISDEEVKRDFIEVGSLHGILPLYEFNYRGHRERHIGLKAQEVEELIPAAVSQRGSYKVVDYLHAEQVARQMAEAA